MLEVARSDQLGEAARRQILRYLKTDSFVGPSDQGGRVVLHCDLLSFSSWEIAHVLEI
jgi:hypothetical protein